MSTWTLTMGAAQARPPDERNPFSPPPVEPFPDLERRGPTERIAA